MHATGDDQHQSGYLATALKTKAELEAAGVAGGSRLRHVRRRLNHLLPLVEQRRELALLLALLLPPLFCLFGLGQHLQRTRQAYQQLFVALDAAVVHRAGPECPLVQQQQQRKRTHLGLSLPECS